MTVPVSPPQSFLFRAKYRFICGSRVEQIVPPKEATRWRWPASSQRPRISVNSLRVNRRPIGCGHVPGGDVILRLPSSRFIVYYHFPGQARVRTSRVEQPPCRKGCSGWTRCKKWDAIGTQSPMEFGRYFKNESFAQYIKITYLSLICGDIKKD